MMKHSLYLKFILAYMIFGFLSFFTIAVFSSQMTLNYLTGQEAEDLYREANYISSNFVRNYYSDAADSTPWLRFIPIFRRWILIWTLISGS